KVKKEISEKTKEIIGHLKDNQISEAKNKHEELRQKISQIPVEYEDDIAEYKTHADTIDNQIKELELLQQKIQEAKNDQKAKVEPKLVIEKIGTEQTIDKKSTEERELKKEKEETKPEPDNEIKEELLKEKIEEIKEEVRNHTQKITELLREEKLKESINEYQIQKAIFDSFEGPHEEKEEMFHDVIASFENIKKFEEHLKEKKKTRIEKKKQEQKEEIEKIKTRAKTITKRIIYNLKKQNLTRAMDEYNNLKHQFQSIPAEFKEERKTLFEHTMKIYMHIKEIEDIIINLQRKKTELKKINNIETSDENIKKMYELKTELRDIIELIKEKKFKEASIEIMDTKHELEKIPQTYEKEVGQFQNLISQMVQKINFLKQINEKRPGETKENA
ncbi:MAG: hypothetical protein KKC26_00845, partial [Nanoarchaeota archaeon]|nr:hypothetical protein [Nanoarchaeota archaeon]